MIKIICIFVILSLIIFHLLKTNKSKVVIDSNATKGGNLDDIENTLSSTQVHTSVEKPSESIGKSTANIMMIMSMNYFGSTIATTTNI